MLAELRPLPIGSLNPAASRWDKRICHARSLSPRSTTWIPTRLNPSRHLVSANFSADWMHGFRPPRLRSS